jgi:hypothetical protein
VTAAFADDDTWHVLMSADDMKRMNIDQLGDAFRLSLIDASTLVWQAGMEGWQRLGSVADVEDEGEEDDGEEIEAEEIVESWEPPTPPRAVTYTSPTRSYAPARASRAQSYAPAPASPIRSYAPAHTSPIRSYAPAHTSPIPSYTPAYTSPTQVYVPVHSPPPQTYAPAMTALDSFVLAQRHAELPEKIDFRRAPGSIRWGRWLVGMLLVTGAVLGAYRQNLLRHGARSIGVESAYLASERRLTAFVSANAPTAVKGVLNSLALLPGPNDAQRPAALLESPKTTIASLAASPMPVTPASVTPPPCVAVVKEPEKSTDVKTVSLDSLPVLRKGSANAKPLSDSDSERVTSQSKGRSAKKADPAPRASKKKARRAAPEAVAKAEPKRKAKRKTQAAPPPPADDNPLRAAMRKVVASDARKLTAR